MVSAQPRAPSGAVTLPFAFRLCGSRGGAQRDVGEAPIAVGGAVVGVEGDGAVVVLDRLVVLVQVVMDEPAIDVSGAVVRVEGEGALEVFDRLAVRAQLATGDSPIAV